MPLGRFFADLEGGNLLPPSHIALHSEQTLYPPKVLILIKSLQDVASSAMEYKVCRLLYNASQL